MDATLSVARHLLSANKLGGYGAHDLGDKLHAADAGVLAAIVIFVGLGLPLACYFRKGCACWEARREAAERAAKADHGRWTAAGGTTASWVQHRLKAIGTDVAPASSGVEMRQAKAAKAAPATQPPPQVTADEAAAPAAPAALKRWGRGAKAAPVMEVEEAPIDEEVGGAGPGTAPAPEQRRGLMGRFGRGKPAAAGRIEKTPVHEATQSSVYTGNESSIGAETDFTESEITEYTESRVSGGRR